MSNTLNQWKSLLSNSENNHKESEGILCDLSYLGLIHITGQDAPKFLQGQFTCDLNEVSETNSTLGAYCNLKGRIISLFRLLPYSFDDSNGFLLQTPYDMIESTMATLKKYALFSKVEISNISEKLIKFGLSSEQSNQLLCEHFNLTKLPQAKNQCITIHHENSKILISCIPGIEEHTRYEIYGLNLSVMHALWQKLNLSIPKVQEKSWIKLDILSKIPQITSDTQAQLLPHHINLPQLGGVSFKKGCYLGQEIIARMEYKGKIKKHLAIIERPNNNPIKIGSILNNKDNQEIGTGLSIFENNDRYLILGCINKNTEMNDSH